MARAPTDQNYFHHPHPEPLTHSHNQLPLQPQFRTPFDLLFDERTGAINYNYINPYIASQLSKSHYLLDELVMRRPRRTRTTYTSDQITELEKYFVQFRYLTSARLAEISNKLALDPAQIKIWFKNRRRRHKIQTDRHKDKRISISNDDISQSPTIKIESNVEESNAPEPRNLHKSNLSRSNNSTPAILTPSPTPTTPTANYIEQYNESLNQYYYNNNHHQHHHHDQNHHNSSITHHIAPLSHQYQTNTAQFFQSSDGGLQRQNHQNFSNHHYQQQQQNNHNHHHQRTNEAQQQRQQYHHQPQQQQRLQSQQNYNNHHQSQYKFQQKTSNSGVLPMAKEDTDFNFNNSYYLRLSLPPTMTAEATRNATAAAPNIVNGPTASMSTNSEVYEPLTPKNDDSPSLCSGGNSSVADDMDEPNMKSLQVLATNRTNGYDEACGNANSIINDTNGCSGEDGGNMNSDIENCTGGVYLKLNKLSPNEMPQGNYQCTKNTFRQAYNTRRKAAKNAQFTYCFN